MRFGRMPVDEARGAVLAHGVNADGLTFKKGRELSAEDILALRQRGIAEVVAALYEDGDQVPLAGVDTGDTTDLPPDSVLHWSSPPPGLGPTAVVVEQSMTVERTPRIADRDRQRHRQQDPDEIRLPVGIGLSEQVLEMEDHRGLGDFQLLGNLVEALAVDQHESDPGL